MRVRRSVAHRVGRPATKRTVSCLHFSTTGSRIDPQSFLSSSSSLTTVADSHTPLGDLPWRAFPSREALQRIDVLTFILGRYPRDPTHSNKAPHVDPTSTHPTTTGTTTEPAATPLARRTTRKGPLSKKGSLEALQDRSRLTTQPTRPSECRAQASPRAQGMPSASADHIHPMTPRCDAQRLAAEWCSIRALHAHQEAKLAEEEERAHERVLTHPPHLFTDEAAVLHQFGMGGRASPAGVPGFDGLFRQHWSDFWVTEMVPDYDAPCGGRPLSRDFDFSVPPLPASAAGLADTTPTPSDVTANEDGPDEAFFQVDLKHRTAELQKEALALLAKTPEKPHSPHASCGDEARPSSAQTEVTCGGASSPANAVFEELSRQEAHLAERQAALSRQHHRRDSHTPSSAMGDDGVALLDATKARPGTYYLQCLLHKQHISHSVALANIAQTLRAHPHAISVAGIKDFIGDTVQRVRLERVSPTAALLANRAFKKRGWRMHLSDFTYESTPLAPGDLFGNHFKIVLRDVVEARPGDIEAAVEAFRQHGFPNYYGVQRFSWFGGLDDAAFALLRHNWVVFAFRFLNYTAKDRTLRELLQRPHKYPHAVQDAYRRNIVRRLRQIAVEPEDLDEAPFLSCPDLHEPLTGIDGGPLNQRQQLVVWQLEQAYLDLQPQSRRLTAQRLASYLWNQALTLRLHHFGSTEVLVGDHVLPAAVRRQMHTLYDRQALTHRYSEVVTEANRDTFTIADVVHPGFSFDGIRLPDNPVGAYYEQICAKYKLDWRARHSGTGLRDFREPARPIVRHPINLSHAYNAAKATLTVEFALERGCYANVAVSELMKRTRCAGAESIVLLPAAESTWQSLGARDPGYVTSMQDIYEGYEDGFGFTRDEVEIDASSESVKKVWDMEGPLFLPDEEDPFRKAHAWGQRHLLSNLERRAADAERLKRQLFEKPLADKLTEDELRQYAGHNIPLSPNMRGKKVFFKVLRRNRRYAGAPKVEPRMQRGASVKNRNHKLPKFRSLNKNAWNVSW